MHHGGRRVLIVWCLLLAAISTAHAQAPATTGSPFTVWLGGGYGRAGAAEFEFTEEAFTFNVSAQRGHLLLSTRVAAVSSSIFDTSWDWGLLAGLASSPGRPIHLGAGLGLGYAEPTNRDGLFTVPAELQVFWRATRYLGLGLYGFATLNGSNSFGGATLAFQLGRLR